MSSMYEYTHHIPFWFWLLPGHPILAFWSFWSSLHKAWSVLGCWGLPIDPWWRIRQLLRDALNEAKDPLGSYLEDSWIALGWLGEVQSVSRFQDLGTQHSGHVDIKMDAWNPFAGSSTALNCAVIQMQQAGRLTTVPYGPTSSESVSSNLEHSIDTWHAFVRILSRSLMVDILRFWLMPSVLMRCNNVQHLLDPCQILLVKFGALMS